MKRNTAYTFIPALLITPALIIASCVAALAARAEYYAPIGWLEKPRLVLYKSKQILELHERGQKWTYNVCLGLDPVGPKTKTGDKKTPEGEYHICYKSAQSSFHRFLGISYPSKQDAQHAFETGKISLNTRNKIIDGIGKNGKWPWNTKMGGWVGIHGYPTDPYRKRWITILYPKPHNWTDGCIAMWDFEIEELYRRVPVGTPITILP